jgi:mannonate dehydratase
MKLGFGFYRHALTKDNYQFARQCSATHAVVHLVDYFNAAGAHNQRDNQPVGATGGGWGRAGDPNKLWELDELLAIKRDLNDAGLVWEAIENFDPAHWHDVLLDGPKKKQQLEQLKRMIATIGRAGIPIVGYNFSIAGVAGRITAPLGRGGAMTVAVDGPCDEPVPAGMVWNMVYDAEAPANQTLPPITHDELWQRLADFLQVMLPVAEDAGVRLAAHPDDPPMPTVRGTPRLVYQPHMYQRLIDISPSRSNQLEFCLGSLAEMTEGNLYDAVEQYSAQNKLAYVHFRNVHGKVPHYHETFVDDGDIDMLRVLRILHRNGFDGVLIPDHTPQMSCDAPWHAGMAFAMGFMRAALRTVQG